MEGLFPYGSQMWKPYNTMRKKIAIVSLLSCGVQEPKDALRISSYANS